MRWREEVHWEQSDLGAGDRVATRGCKPAKCTNLSAVMNAGLSKWRIEISIGFST